MEVFEMKIITAAAVLALLSAPAFGTPCPPGPCIAINGSGSLTFTQAANNSLEVSSGPLSGMASYVSSIPGNDSSGTATFGTTHFFTGPEVVASSPPGVFIAVPPADQTFHYQSNTGDDLRADITWMEVVANAPAGEPQLVGTGDITSSVGNIATDFPAPDGMFSITANFPASCGLELLVAGQCSGNVSMAMFEGLDDFTPFSGGGGPGGGGMMPPDLPEPMSSFMAVGLALCCLWGTYQWTRREREGAMS
jgi:hypothetical protein